MLTPLDGGSCDYTIHIPHGTGRITSFVFPSTEFIKLREMYSLKVNLSSDAEYVRTRERLSRKKIKTIRWKILGLDENKLEPDVE